MESKRIVRRIDRLLLDPNNYRFIDRPEYKFIPDSELADSRVQLRTLCFVGLLRAKNNLVEVLLFHKLVKLFD